MNYRLPDHANTEEIINTCQDCVNSNYNKSNPINYLRCSLHNIKVHVNATCDDVDPIT